MLTGRNGREKGVDHNHYNCPHQESFSLKTIVTADTAESFRTIPSFVTPPLLR
jgi:hypothetical protein